MQVETSPSELALTKIKLMYHEKTNSAFVYSVKGKRIIYGTSCEMIYILLYLVNI